MYETAYRSGISADPRGKEGVDRVLRRAKKDFDELPERKRWEFDLPSSQMRSASFRSMPDITT